MIHMWEKIAIWLPRRICTGSILHLTVASSPRSLNTHILDSGNAVDAIYLDFRQAFDTVPHKRLLTKSYYNRVGIILGRCY